jgi:anthranilate synthase/aminodeoxychorismate synthase-like glutamine amidotransferase
MILLIDNYDSFTYNIYQCIEAFGFRCQVVRNDAITLDEIRKLKPEKIVLSPGPGDPSSAGITLQVIERFSQSIPILGVCLGHQAIGQAFGGKVIRAELPKHGKLSMITHEGRGLYKGLSRPFVAARYHSLILEKGSLPDCLEITAECDDGVIMGVKHKTLQVEGVQFHPESIATEEGPKIIENFLKQERKK